MRNFAAVTAAALLLLAFAGCTDNGDSDDSTPKGPSGAGEALTFETPWIIDDVRAGGEPVIAQLPTGTILISSHPGWTHIHPSDDVLEVTDQIVPANLQSYLWRSTDNGTTFQHVDLLAAVPNLPRSTALGVSDPEFTVLDDGTVCMTDLIALASSSVSCSSDDGVTWLPGNSLASMGVNDRQWLASTGQELYFTANYFVNHRIQASNDNGLTWELRGDVPCSQDLISNPHTDHLIVGCPNGVAVSEDAGFTWEVRASESGAGGQRIMSEPAIDAAGWVYQVGTKGERELMLMASPDEGATWPYVHDLTDDFATFAGNGNNGTYVWPWASAGSDGRVAVSFIGKYDEESSATSYGPWYMFTMIVLEANTAYPDVTVAQWTPDPIHEQPICQSGTTCQVSSMAGDPSGDRRLGDFFETTISSDGYLLGTWSNTAKFGDDWISHVEFSKQLTGPQLLTDADRGVFTPTQG